MAAENILADSVPTERHTYEALALESALPHGLACPCLMCSDMRRHIGARPLPTELECRAREMLTRLLVAEVG
jgi:hypothetical protein